MMHTVELLERAIALATQAGFVVRQDWLSGAAPGVCSFNGRNWLVIDLAQSPSEQLELVLSALAQLPQAAETDISRKIVAVLRLRKAA